MGPKEGPKEHELIGDRYELGEAIGRGGMATIHKAMDVRMGREVAVKILREVYSSDPKFVTRFQREARAASALQHPNIVQVFDYGQSSDSYFIVMELINGADLRRYLKREGILEPERAVEIAHDVALGLGAAHRRTIVHRDVKPQNILLDDDGLVKLTDFGIASMYKEADAERLTTTGMTLGTVQYYAPEQAQGEIVTPAADIYALGIVMYEMLTGRTPFDGDTPVAVAMRHIQDLPEPPSHLNPEIPPALERIILRCLEKDPRDRYPNGDALAYALENYARGPQRRFGSSSTGIRPQIGPLGLPGVEGRAQPGRSSNGASQFGASAVMSGPRRGTAPPPPPDAPGSEFYDAPTYEGGYNEGGNAVSTNPWSTARGTVPRISGSPNGEYGAGRKHTGLIITIVGAVLALLIIGCAGVYALSGGFLSGTTTPPAQLTTVPQFVGLQFLDAQVLAQNNHLKLNATPQASDKPANEVLSQDIDNGQKVPYNQTVNVAISSGPGKVVVPDVVGKSQSDACGAQGLLTQAGFTCNIVGYQASDLDAGDVVSTDPPGNTSVDPKVTDTVNLIISTGPAPQPTATPAPQPTATPAPQPTATPCTTGPPTCP